MKHEIFMVNNINDREEVLNTLSHLYTDEDFNGDNGELFTMESALENGFESSQEYVVDVLKNSGLEGINLIKGFFHQWLDEDGYYGEWSLRTVEIGNAVIVSYAVIENV